VAAGERIRQLQRELRRLGYYDFQIKDMIFEAAGKTEVEKFSPEEAERVAERLSEQVSFALKCLRAGAE
jgi:peptidoglycan hydrolase-like protein with peptidoglycan-binding domain